MKTADVAHGKKKKRLQDGKSNNMERRLALLTNKTEGEQRILIGKDKRG